MNYLYDHVHKVHQQNMPHSCDLCHEKFADKSSLVKHALTSCPGKPLNSTENAETAMSSKVIRLSGDVIIIYHLDSKDSSISLPNFNHNFHSSNFR